MVCVVGEQGEVIERFTVANDAAGLKQMTRRLLRAGVEQVGIERGDGPVVAALLLAALTIFVIPPSQVKNPRSRDGSAGNKDDRFDAYVVRTDARRLRPMVFDTEQTTRCAPACVHAGTWSPIGSRWVTSCAPICRSCSRLLQRCSAASTPG